MSFVCLIMTNNIVDNIKSKIIEGFYFIKFELYDIFDCAFKQNKLSI